VRWYLQVEARFARAHDPWVEEAVAEHLLEVAAIQPDADSVHGDPGQRIWAGITLDAEAADSAAAGPVPVEASGGRRTTAPRGR